MYFILVASAHPWRGQSQHTLVPGARLARVHQTQRVGELRNIRRFVGITTSGSPWWWLALIGNPGRSLFMRGLRPLYAKGCRMKWLQLYNMNHVTQAEREGFLVKVRRELAAI